MKLTELAERIGAQVLCAGRGGDVDAEQVYAGDRISDLLNAAGEHVLLVTNLASGQLVQMAELLDVPAICVVNGRGPEAAVVAAASGNGTLLMVCSASLFETCGRIHACLAAEVRSR